MKSTLSWQDALKQLADTMPQEDTPQPTETEKTKAKKLPTLRVEIDRKGRNGKTATIISGFCEDDADFSDDEVNQIASLLKKQLGVGGSSRGGEILIQGDRRAQVVEILKSKGYKVKG